MPTNTTLLLPESRRHGSVRPGVSGTFPGKIKQLFLTTCINTIYICFPARCCPHSPARDHPSTLACVFRKRPANSISRLLAPSILFGGLKIQQTAQC